MVKSEILGASAGSGKTFRLTERTFESIQSDNPLVIAVTFTRAATAEMRKRILDKVDGADLAYGDKLRQIMRAGGVRFSTFDSFFYQLLAACGDPVEIADERQAQIITEKIAGGFFNEIARAGKIDEILIACTLLGTPIEKLTGELADGRAGRFSENDVSEEKFSKIVAETARLRGEIGKLLESFRLENSEKLSARVRQTVLGLSGVDIQELTGKAALTHRDLSDWGWLGKIDWSAAPHARINAIFVRLREKLAQYLRNRAILRELTLTEMHEVYQAAAKNVKRQERKIFFEDILERLIALDGKEAKERAEVMGLYFELGLDRVRHLLIDEFQDTSRDNLELIFPLIEEILSEVGENGEGERSLFIVGDWKQMIYGWRGADREAVTDRLSRFVGRQLQKDFLPCNWRSTPLLIELFNRTVSEIFPGSGASEQQQAPAEKTYGAVSEINLFSVEIARNQKNGFYERMIEKIREKKVEWGCDYSDITLIFRTNTEKESMARELAEAGIGFAEVRGRQLLASEEGVAVFSLLAYLFAGEGSAFFQKSLEASSLCDGLLQIAGKKEEILSRYASPYGLQAVADVLEMCRGNLPDSVIETCAEEAEALFRMGGSSAEEFLSNIFKVRDKVSVPEPTRSDRVKLATIHGAKGLEFPHVFLLWIEQNRASRFYVPGFQCHMSFNKDEIAFWESCDSIEAAQILEARKKEVEKSENEKANLLYVAMTRARNTLTIFVKKRKNDGETEDLTGKIISVIEQGSFDAEVFRGEDSICWRKDYGPQKEKEPKDIVKIAPFRRPASKEPVMETVELDRSFVSEDVRAGIERGERIHTFLAKLGNSPGVPAGHGLSAEELRAVSAFLEDTTVAEVVFRPGRLYTEQAISNRVFYGVVDRMIVEKSRITVIDFKTGAAGELLESYLAQLRRYGAIMKSLYPDRAVEAYLLFVDAEEKVVRVELGPSRVELEGPRDYYPRPSKR